MSPSSRRMLACPVALACVLLGFAAFQDHVKTFESIGLMPRSTLEKVALPSGLRCDAR